MEELPLGLVEGPKYLPILLFREGGAGGGGGGGALVVNSTSKKRIPIVKAANFGLLGSAGYGFRVDGLGYGGLWVKGLAQLRVQGFRGRCSLDPCTS